MKTISVLLADDHVVVRQGLHSLLSADPDILVVGEASNGSEAVEMALQLKPNVIVMDLAMPKLNGMEAARQIMDEGLPSKLIILSSYDDDEYVRQLADAGASGYLVKQTAANDLIRAVREASRGNVFFSPSISRKIQESGKQAGAYRRSARKRGGPLSSREFEVLQMISEGYLNRQIAEQLGISIKTVEKHRQHLMNKLNTHEIAGLTRYAVAHGIVENRVRIAAPEDEPRPVDQSRDPSALADAPSVPA